MITTESTRASFPLGDNLDAYAYNALNQPAYHLKLGDIGGGAVGMVPFDLDHKNCSPESDCIFDTGCSRSESEVIPVPIIKTSRFMQDGVFLVFLGPVRPGTTNSGAKLVSLYACNEWGVPHGPDLADSSTILATVQPNGAAPFSRVVRAKLLQAIADGRYIITRYEGSSGHDGLLCDQVIGTYPVDAFTYNFFLSAADDGTGDDNFCDSADFDCDGDVGTDDDIRAFFACLAGDCPAPPCTNDADFNNDGDTATDADIEAFFRVLAGGPC